MAGVISAASLGLVVGWYFYSEPQNKNVTNQQPIAVVKQIKEEVDRRPAKRQVWQAIVNGEPVYSGEAIRTAKGSEVKIQFLDGSRSIDIEPESIVMILQSANKEFSLDLMEGGASVIADKADAGKFNLIQNGKTVELKGAATLSKSGTGGLEIQSDDSGAGGNSFFATMNDSRLAGFKLVQPAKDKSFLIDVNKPTVDMIWAGVPPGFKTKIAIGSERNNLDKVFETNGLQFELNLASGFYFYKLYFTNPATGQVVGESKLQRLKINERRFPVFVSPTASQFIQIVNQSANPKYKMLFDWTEGEFVTKYLIEVATDSSLKNKVINQTVTKKAGFEQELSPGEYFVRMSALFEGEAKPISGKVEKFTISLNRKIDPSTIGLNLIFWGEDAELQFYINQPELAMTWKTDLGKKIGEYRIKLQNSDDPYAPAQEVRSRDFKTKTKVFKPGRYIASIQGVDQGENVIANSQKRFFVVKELDMVKPPVILGEPVLQASRDGALTIKWNLATGAHKYKIRLIDELGQQVYGRLLESAQAESANLTDLMPGLYLLELAGVDMLGRTGEVAQRKIDVPAMSSLGAPKIKKLKVK
ncbi:MAG: FecR domain-containing protein [Bdellovibrionota bacterium]